MLNDDSAKAQLFFFNAETQTGSLLLQHFTWKPINNHEGFWDVLEPVTRMSPVKMAVASKYSQISLGSIGKLLFMQCYGNR